LRGQFPAPRCRRPWLGLAGLGLASLLAVAVGAEVIDRVVAVVGPQAITASEVEQQLRLEALFNHEPLVITPHNRSQALQRLIAIRLIQSETAMAGFLRTNEAEVQRRLEQSRQERYLGGLTFAQALAAHDLREEDVADFWRQVIGYERFKDFRFKTGLEVSRDEVAAYYQRHIVPEVRAQGNANPPPLDEVYNQVERAVIEERANEMLEEWLKETRPQTRIVILEEQQPSNKESEAGRDASAARPAGPR
jgi:hypothetical protein